jgi:hypothetical protein
VRTLAITTLALVLCGTAAASAPRYSTQDLAGIVDPRPQLGWKVAPAQPYLYPRPAHPPAFTLKEWLGESPPASRREVARNFKAFGFIVGRHHVWKTRPGGHPANVVVFAYLFHTAAGASAGVDSFVNGRLDPSAHLGEESTYEDYGRGAVVVWRRDNLMLYAAVDCPAACGFDALTAARTYARQIDARARSVPH